MIDPDTQQAWTDRTKLGPNLYETKGPPRETSRVLAALPGAIERALDPDGPYLHVRVAARTPGGLEATFDFDAEDAAAGVATLKLVGVHLAPGSAQDVTSDEAGRLEKLLNVARRVYALSIADEWAQAVKAVGPEVTD
jgi:hypothetical protein